MTKKRKYIDVNVPLDFEPYLSELLQSEDIQKRLEVGKFSKTYSGLGLWIIHEFLVSKTSFRFQHLNTKENHITITDNKLHRVVDIYPKEPQHELWCELDDSTQCDHVKFALTIPDVRKALEKRGWKLPEV